MTRLKLIGFFTLIVFQVILSENHVSGQAPANGLALSALGALGGVAISDDSENETNGDADELIDPGAIVPRIAHTGSVGGNRKFLVYYNAIIPRSLLLERL